MADVLKDHLAKGWIHARMFFEVMGGTEDVTTKAMKDHLESLKKMQTVKIVSEKYSSVEEVKDPPKQFSGGKAYSQVVEVEIVVNSVENLIYSVIFYGPSSVEVIEPKEMKIGLDAVQSMSNAVAELMHRYASFGAGGIVISTKK